MTFAFDLISDLHIETWDSFDWTGQPTSPYCVVAGDVCRDRAVLVDVLTHLGQCYSAVFYIDGNDEHKYYLEDLGQSYQNLNQQLSVIANVVYLQDNVVIVNGVAIIATNAWWTYDFDPDIEVAQSVEWYRERQQISLSAALSINSIAYHDAAYLVSTVARLQTHQDVKSIVIVTHTLPASWIIDHDLDLVNTWRFNCMGNRHLLSVLAEDTEHKITTWCFGHYHKNVNREFAGVQFLNNCRGRGDTEFSQSAYYPKRIEIAV